MNVKRPDRLYKSDRLNYIVSRMRVKQDVTPTDLAEELHVSERTIYRDLSFLNTARSLKKRYSRREGRYLLETELTLPPVTLTPSEALALYTAASIPALTNGSFFAADLRGALNKLGESLAPDAAREAQAAANRSANALFGPIMESIQRPTLEMIRRAIRSNRKLRIRYWSAATDGEQNLTVAPYDLRFTEGAWYLLANTEHDGIRTFKITRVRTGEILSDRFRFPRRFSADDCFARAWELSGHTDKDLAMTVRFAPSVAGLIADTCGQRFSTVEPQADGSVICTMEVTSASEVAWWILSYGSTAEVLSPPELRADFAQTAAAMAAQYGTATRCLIQCLDRINRIFRIDRI